MARRDDLIALGILLAAIAMGLWVYDGADAFALARPLSYTGDGLSHGFVVKTILDVGWYPVHNPFVGAPFGGDLFDYPFSDGANFLLLRLIGLFAGNWVATVNAFFVATFFLCGISAYVVLRRFGIGRAAAVAGGVLFALAPYHFGRRGHLLLAACYAVPVGVWLAWKAWHGERWQARTRRSRLWTVAGVVVAASGGAYYAFISTFLIAVAAVARALSMRSAREAVPGFALALGLAFVVVVNVSPSLVYRASYGSNPEVARRNSGESEIYGLKLTQLLLPYPEHHSGLLRHVTERYSGAAPLINENAVSALGLVGAAGLAFLLLMALSRLFGGAATNSLLPFLATMALAAFLLGTIGGLGSLFSYLITPILRSYNRVSIFIAFVSVAAIVSVVDKWKRTTANRGVAVRVVAAGALVGIAWWDQVPVPPPVPAIATFDSDRAFVQRLEGMLPKGSGVLQLPYQPFPEAGTVAQLENYGLLRGYLHSAQLHWSYGAMKGRAGDSWLRALAQHEPAEVSDLAADSGFAALYIDRRGYEDGGRATESQLRDHIGAPIAESADGNLVAYRLSPRGSEPVPLERLLGSIDTPIRFDRQTFPGLVEGVEGFSGWEPWGRWTEGPVARVRLSRALPPSFTLRLETAMALSPTVESGLRVRAGKEEQSFRVGPGPSTVDIPLHTSEGVRTIEFVIPAPRSPAELGLSADARKLGVGIKSMTVLPR